MMNASILRKEHQTQYKKSTRNERKPGAYQLRAIVSGNTKRQRHTDILT